MPQSKTRDPKTCRHLSGQTCTKLDILAPSPKMCGACKHYKRGPARRSVGLGDWVHHGIMFLSLGQGERVARRAAKALGKKGCGCKKRQQKLNQLGERLTGGSA